MSRSDRNSISSKNEIQSMNKLGRMFMVNQKDHKTAEFNYW